MEHCWFWSSISPIRQHLFISTGDGARIASKRQVKHPNVMKIKINMGFGETLKLLLLLNWCILMKLLFCLFFAIDDAELQIILKSNLFSLYIHSISIRFVQSIYLHWIFDRDLIWTTKHIKKEIFFFNWIASIHNCNCTFGSVLNSVHVPLFLNDHLFQRDVIFLEHHSMQIHSYFIGLFTHFYYNRNKKNKKTHFIRLIIQSLGVSMQNWMNFYWNINFVLLFTISRSHGHSRTHTLLPHWNIVL